MPPNDTATLYTGIVEIFDVSRFVPTFFFVPVFHSHFSGPLFFSFMSNAYNFSFAMPNRQFFMQTHISCCLIILQLLYALANYLCIAYYVLYMRCKKHARTTRRMSNVYKLICIYCLHNDDSHLSSSTQMLYCANNTVKILVN